MHKPGVVNQVPCAACSSCYIGQICRTLELRLKKHKIAVDSGDTDASALVEHWLWTGHRVDWENLNEEVIDSCLDWRQWCSLESWHIHS